MKIGNPIVRAFGNTPFVVVTCILLVSAVSLNAATRYLQLYFQKLPVDMRQPISAIPEKLGPWVQISKDRPLSGDMEHELGTKIYLKRTYIDTRIAGADVLKSVENKSFEERDQIAEQIRRQHPAAVMFLHSVYYTGLVDTVAHVPDRCYVAGGYEPTKKIAQEWNSVSKLIDPSGQTKFASPYITFEDQKGMTETQRLNVAYMFHANGHFEPDADNVRFALQNLRNRFAYYAKVEMMTIGDERESSGRAMDDFLGFLLPEYLKLLPDWNEVMSRPVK